MENILVKVENGTSKHNENHKLFKVLCTLCSYDGIMINISMLNGVFIVLSIDRVCSFACLGWGGEWFLFSTDCIVCLVIACDLNQALQAYSHYWLTDCDYDYVHACVLSITNIVWMYVNTTYIIIGIKFNDSLIDVFKCRKNINFNSVAGVTITIALCQNSNEEFIKYSWYLNIKYHINIIIIIHNNNKLWAELKNLSYCCQKLNL